MINHNVIPKGDDTIDHIWNVYNSQKILDEKCSKFTNMFISEDDGK